jgi:hypothetical protein
VLSISGSANSDCISTNLLARSSHAHDDRSDILASISAILSTEFSIAFVKFATSFSLSFIESPIASKASLNTCSVILVASFCNLAVSFKASSSSFSISFNSFSLAIVAADFQPQPHHGGVGQPHQPQVNHVASISAIFLCN